LVLIPLQPFFFSPGISVNHIKESTGMSRCMVFILLNFSAGETARGLEQFTFDLSALRFNRKE